MGSRLRTGGTQLLYAHPVTGGKTFKPSGDPAKIEPSHRVPPISPEARLKRVDFDRQWQGYIDGVMGGVETRYMRRVLEEGRHWESIRFQANKTPRARKRALEREARRERQMKANSQ